MHPATQTVVVLASIVIIGAGLLYGIQHVNCADFFGLIKGCAVTR